MDSVTRFLPLSFFHQNIRPGLMIVCLFEYKFEFAKILEFLKMHAVSLTPHAQCMCVIDTACMVHAVSLTPHAKQIF
jgi:hypothetical protein